MGSTLGARVATGKVTGTGSVIEIELDFNVGKVELFNVDGLATLVWTKSMLPGYGLKQITAGTISLITSNGVTPVKKQVFGDSGDPRGFKIGADTDINVSAEVIHWVATEDRP